MPSEEVEVPGDHFGRVPKRYTPSNIDFLSIPGECKIDWGAEEYGFLLNINRIYGMMAAYSEPLQTQDPISAYLAVNEALRRFWLFHHSDFSIPTWDETTCWRIAHRYWAG